MNKLSIHDHSDDGGSSLPQYNIASKPGKKRSNLDKNTKVNLGQQLSGSMNQKLSPKLVHTPPKKSQKASRLFFERPSVNSLSNQMTYAQIASAATQSPIQNQSLSYNTRRSYSNFDTINDTTSVSRSSPYATEASNLSHLKGSFNQHEKDLLANDSVFRKVNDLQSRTTRSKFKTAMKNMSPSKPSSTKQYIEISTPVSSNSLQDEKLKTPRKLLIILDLNGTLLCRTNRKSSFIKRQSLDKFIEYIFQNHNVMIWSSSTPQNVCGIVDKLFTKSQQSQILAVWGRDTLRLTEQQYYLKVQVYKQLSWVWNSEHETLRQFDQKNTVLIDDSSLKAASEPYNLLQIPEFLGQEESTDTLSLVKNYLEWLACQKNVSNAIRQKPFKTL